MSEKAEIKATNHRKKNLSAPAPLRLFSGAQMPCTRCQQLLKEEGCKLAGRNLSDARGGSKPHGMEGEAGHLSRRAEQVSCGDYVWKQVCHPRVSGSQSRKGWVRKY